MGRAGLVRGSRGRLSLVPRLSLALSVRRVRRTAASAPGLPPLRLAAAGVGDGLGPGASLQRSAQGLAARAFVLPRAGVCVRVVPCPALAPLLSAAAGVGGDGLLGRRARRRARALRCGLCSSRAVSRVFGGREHEIAERVHAAIYESASFRLRTPIDAMVASVQPSTMRSPRRQPKFES